MLNRDDIIRMAQECQLLLTRWVCGWFHGGGIIKRDPAGNINWQCARCGAWADPVNKNAALQKTVDLLQASLIELLDEYHPPEHWTDAHIEHENKQGNMMAPVVRRAKDAVQAAIRARGEK